MEVNRRDFFKIMGISGATAAMVGGKMKHNAHSLNCFLSNSRIFEVGLHKLNSPVL